MYIYMEKKEMGVKTEEAIGSSSFGGYNSNSLGLSSVFDFPEVEKSSLGIMELLGVQDYGTPLLDLPHPSPPALKDPSPSHTANESCEAFYQHPPTPNSSSISSASSEAVNDEQTKTVDQPEDQPKTKKQWASIHLFFTFFFWVMLLSLFLYMLHFLEND